jgi:hypothetical protein
MSETTERRGHCLCGAIQIAAKTAGNRVGACHCNMCRRWGGGPFMEMRTSFSTARYSSMKSLLSTVSRIRHMT